MQLNDRTNFSDMNCDCCGITHLGRRIKHLSYLSFDTIDKLVIQNVHKFYAISIQNQFVYNN